MRKVRKGDMNYCNSVTGSMSSMDAGGYPYGADYVCCVSANKGFHISNGGACTNNGGKIFRWPEWEAIHGCSPPPPGDSPETPTCCITTDDEVRYLFSVRESTLLNCKSQTSSSFSLSWCSAPVCLSGNVAVNYPNGLELNDRTLLVLHQEPDPANGAARLLLYTGMTVLMLVLMICFFICAIAILRLMCGCIRRSTQQSTVLRTRSDVSFTTLNMFSYQAESLPDLPPTMGPVPDGKKSLNEDESQSTPTVVVVMPDDTLRLGEGDSRMEKFPSIDVESCPCTTRLQFSDEALDGRGGGTAGEDTIPEGRPHASPTVVAHVDNAPNQHHASTVREAELSELFYPANENSCELDIDSCQAFDPSSN